MKLTQILSPPESGETIITGVFTLGKTELFHKIMTFQLRCWHCESNSKIKYIHNYLKVLSFAQIMTILGTRDININFTFCQNITKPIYYTDFNTDNQFHTKNRPKSNVNGCPRFHSNTPGWNWICPISSKEWRWEKGRNNFTRISINFVDTMNWKNKIKLSFDPTLAAIIDDVKYFVKVCLRIRAIANWYYLAHKLFDFIESQ